jgi:hypothetical protein
MLIYIELGNKRGDYRLIFCFIVKSVSRPFFAGESSLKEIKRCNRKGKPMPFISLKLCDKGRA